MTFEDLPPQWNQLSLRNPQIAANVVDLIVTDHDRRSNALALLLCDNLGRLVRPLTITSVSWGCPEADRRRPFDMLRELLSSEPFASVEGLVVAFGHRQPRTRMTDRVWARTARSRLDQIGVDLFGCYVAHSRGVVRLPQPEVRHADAS